MYKKFAFEGDIHTSLACVPLTVRRKLDLAAIKISLAGWQQLPREARLCLCHLPVEAPEELAVYRDVLLAFCERHGVPHRPLEDPSAAARAWNSPTIPPGLAARLPGLGARLDDARWSELDEETRYALVKLSDPKRSSDKLAAALGEVGLAEARAPEATAAGPCTPGLPSRT